MLYFGLYVVIYTLMAKSSQIRGILRQNARIRCGSSNSQPILTVSNFIATVRAAIQTGCLSIFQPSGERGQVLPSRSHPLAHAYGGHG